MGGYFNQPATIGGNDHISGKWGEIFDESGRAFGTTQEFESNIELNKEELMLPRRLMAVHKVTSATGSGSISFNKINTEFQEKLLKDPFAKYNYVGSLDDPTVNGMDQVLFRGVSFDSIPILNFSGDEISAIEVDFTFEGVEYQKSIKR